MKKLIRLWKKRVREYDEAATINRKMATDVGPKNSLIARGCLLAANRYEGIATATRWAIEDLAKELKKPNRKA